MLTLIKTTSDHSDFQTLVRALDEDLAIRDGKEHAFYAQFNGLASLNHVVVSYDKDQAVGCGAFKRHDESTVEIKRMYTRPEVRGKGIASKILNELETWAKQEHYEMAILETGIRQPEAIALYHKCGYIQIPNYGQYEGVKNSLCFQKQLK